MDEGTRIVSKGLLSSRVASVLDQFYLESSESIVVELLRAVFISSRSSHE
jgi:hypothetical protein